MVAQVIIRWHDQLHKILCSRLMHNHAQLVARSYTTGGAIMHGWWCDHAWLVVRSCMAGGAIMCNN